MALQNLNSPQDVLKSAQEIMNSSEFKGITMDQILQAHAVHLQYEQVKATKKLIDALKPKPLAKTE